jgi:hypothetical protein
MSAAVDAERDRLVLCLERATLAAEHLQAELADEQRALEQALHHCRDGAPVSRLLSPLGSHSFPESLTDPTARFGEAIHDCRAELIRCLVDDEGWTLSRVADETGHSRQRVSRLYHSTRTPGGRSEP